MVFKCCQLLVRIRWHYIIIMSIILYIDYRLQNASLKRILYVYRSNTTIEEDRISQGFNEGLITAYLL